MASKIRSLLFLFSLFGFIPYAAIAQKIFIEGIIVYKVKLEFTNDDGSPGHYDGTYTYTIKGKQLKKELKLNNGYQDIVLFNYNKNSVYSLQNKDGKKYAIQLKMDDVLKDQEEFEGFTLTGVESDHKKIAGYAAAKGIVKYLDGTQEEIYYTNKLYIDEPTAFERLPAAKFLPLFHVYKDKNGMTMEFEAEKAEETPVENAVFAIPPDYKIVSNAEYMQLSK